MNFSSICVCLAAMLLLNFCTPLKAAPGHSYTEYIEAGHQLIKEKKYTDGERYAFGAVTMLEEKVKKKQSVPAAGKDQYLLTLLPTLFNSCLRHKLRQLKHSQKATAGQELVKQDDDDDEAKARMDDPQVRALYTQTDVILRRIYNAYRVLFGDRSAITAAAGREVTEVENAIKSGG